MKNLLPYASKFLPYGSKLSDVWGLTFSIWKKLSVIWKRHVCRVGIVYFYMEKTFCRMEVALLPSWNCLLLYGKNFFSHESSLSDERELVYSHVETGFSHMEVILHTCGKCLWGNRFSKFSY